MNLFWTLCLTLSAVFVGYDSALFNSLQALPSVSRRSFNSHLIIPQFFAQFPELATDSNLLGIVGAVYSLAGIYTPFFAGWLADKYGRKVPIIAGMIGLCFSPAVMACAKSLGVLILGRWLLGTSTLLCMNICVALLVEIAQSVQTAFML
jgi:DHA1 family tetracycline resistance protein-like MFS transporter